MRNLKITLLAIIIIVLSGACAKQKYYRNRVSEWGSIWLPTDCYVGIEYNYRTINSYQGSHKAIIVHFRNIYVGKAAYFDWSARYQSQERITGGRIYVPSGGNGTDSSSVIITCPQDSFPSIEVENLRIVSSRIDTGAYYPCDRVRR